jgi:hypothetical protein
VEDCSAILALIDLRPSRLGDIIAQQCKPNRDLKFFASIHHERPRTAKGGARNLCRLVLFSPFNDKSTMSSCDPVHSSSDQSIRLALLGPKVPRGQCDYQSGRRALPINLYVSHLLGL